MKYRLKILIVVVFIMVSLLIIGKSSGQQQRTARSAETALQTFFSELTGDTKYYLISKFIFPDEDWQQNREASSGSFHLLLLSFIVFPILLVHYFNSKRYKNPLSCEYEIVFNR